jgi:hypothetical protein
LRLSFLLPQIGARQGTCGAGPAVREGSAFERGSSGSPVSVNRWKLIWAAIANYFWTID